VDHSAELDELFTAEHARDAELPERRRAREPGASLPARAAELRAAALAAAPSFQREHSYGARVAELLRSSAF